MKSIILSSLVFMGLTSLSANAAVNVFCTQSDEVTGEFVQTLRGTANFNTTMGTFGPWVANMISIASNDGLSGHIDLQGGRGSVSWDEGEGYMSIWEVRDGEPVTVRYRVSCLGNVYDRSVD